MCELRYRDAGVTYERYVYSERIEEGDVDPGSPRGASDRLYAWRWRASPVCSPPRHHIKKKIYMSRARRAWGDEAPRSTHDAAVGPRVFASCRARRPARHASDLPSTPQEPSQSTRPYVP